MLRMLSYEISYAKESANKEISVRFDDEALLNSTPDAEGKMPWTAIKRVFASDACLILFVSKLERSVVPRRALPSGEALNNLIRYAKERVNGQAL